MRARFTSPQTWSTRLRRLAKLALSAPMLALAAGALPPALQSELDRAVLDYESQRLDAARRGFESLARRNVPAAQYNLAMLHLRGEMPRPDEAEAVRLLIRAAQSGFVTAQVMLGELHENGRAVPRDLVLAHQWYEVAATAGSVSAQVAMGTAYFLGRGRPKDMAAAARWYREAAKGGDVGAQYLLASMYERGDGVALDLRLARYWYGVAASQGDEAAPGKVRQLDAQMARPPS